MNPFVFVKQENTDLATSVDLAQALSAGETITPGSVSVVSLAPATPIPLQVTSIADALTVVSFTLVGGEDTLSYGVRLQFTTSLAATREVLLAVVVRSSLNVPYATKNPFAYQSLIDEVAAGDAAVGKGFFVLPSGANAVNCYVLWELMDSQGEIYSSGNAYDIRMTVDTFATTIEADAVVHVPSSVPPSLDSQKYQIRWSLIDATTNEATYAFESIRVLGLTSDPTGVQDNVELVGDQATLTIVLPDLYDTVGFEIFAATGNSSVLAFTPVMNPQRVSSGWFYQGVVNTSTLTASTAPYIVSWKYFNSASPWSSYRETARLFVINPSMMNAIEDTRRTVNRAKATLFQFADMVFDTQTLISFLRRGKDTFNGAGGYVTTFDMTDATGGVRDFWLGYSEVAMLEAQALAEGEKAFDFQGQAIQLTVDRTQYYNQAADNLRSRLENNVRPYKMNLQLKGISGGSGNVDNATMGRSSAFVGITVHPASQYGRYYHQNRFSS